MQIHNLLNNEIADIIETLGIKWVNILKQYEHKYDSTDSIHWFIERTNVGALATSAWLCGGVALEEYTTTKETTKEYNGRCDLYFHIENLKAICEAKMKWIEIKQDTMLNDVIFGVLDTIKLAQSDSNAHKTAHRKMYATFISTYWKSEIDDVIDQTNVEQIIEGVLKNQENSASYKFKTETRLISSAGNVCNLSYLVIGDA